MISWGYIPAVNFPVPGLPLQKTANRQPLHPRPCDCVASVRRHAWLV